MQKQDLESVIENFTLFDSHKTSKNQSRLKRIKNYLKLLVSGAFLYGNLALNSPDAESTDRNLTIERNKENPEYVDISWQSSEARQYRVLQGDNLKDWFPATGDGAEQVGNGTILKFTDKTIDLSMRKHFYKLEEQILYTNTNSMIQDNIEYIVGTDKQTYNLGEDVEVMYKVTNLRTEEWSFTGFYPLMEIVVEAKEGEDFNEIWHWSWYKIHPMGPMVFSLPPRGFKKIRDNWPQLDQNETEDNADDDTPVISGAYRISGFIPRYRTNSTVSVDITIQDCSSEQQN